MHVSLVGSGGFTGQRLSASVDTDELPPGQRIEALEALESLVATPPPTGSGGAGQPRYQLTVQPGEQEQIVELTESQIPSALRPLVTELLKRAQTRV